MQTKVLVIGGGPAGATSARLLAENNIDTILIDKDLTFQKPCGGAVPSSLFEELNIPKAVIKKEVNSIRLISPKGKEAMVLIRNGFIGIVKRGIFDSVLRALAEKAGAKVIEGRFERFISTGSSIVSEVSVDGVCKEIISDYIIAADGINSRVSSRLDIHPPKSVFTVSETLDARQTESCEFWFGSSPNLYSWVFPEEGGIKVGTGALRSVELKSEHEAFLKKRGLSSEGSRRGYRVPLWNEEDRFTALNERVLFVGDSGAQVMPFTFEGIYYSMKSAELLAVALVEGNPSDYKRLWRKRFLSRYRFMKRLWSLFGRNKELVEKFVSLHQIPSVQESALRLWLDKGSGRIALFSYIKALRMLL
ncbi:MAG: geranylgeranyl reductase family protein [Nitrospirae bacterium]|nr:geranylgeranyl reductase family protein [Nitrospirota bacterium]